MTDHMVQCTISYLVPMLLDWRLRTTHYTQVQTVSLKLLLDALHPLGVDDADMYVAIGAL